MNKILVSIVVIILAAFLVYQSLKPEPKIESAQEHEAPVSLETIPDQESKDLENAQNIPSAETPTLPSSSVNKSPLTDSGIAERPSPVPPDSEILRADNAQTETLKSRLASDSRIQGAAIIESVACDSGTCLVTAKSRTSMEQEVETAFTLFQKDYPEFGSKFKMEISPDAQGVSTFMFAP